MATNNDPGPASRRRRMSKPSSRAPPINLTMEACADINLVEICEADKKSVFVLDLDATHVDGMRPVFFNTALGGRSSLLAKILEQVDPGDQDHAHFVEWMKSAFCDTSCFTYQGLLWTSTTLRKRWRVISGIVLPAVLNTAVNRDQSTLISPAPSSPALTRIDSVSVSSNETPGDDNLDWTITPPPPNLSSHVEFIRSVNWAATTIGPMSSWPPLLRSICNMIMADPDPAAIFWGDYSSMIYNEAFISIAGQKHPKLMGQHPAKPFAEVWAYFEGIIETCRATGKSRKEDNVCLFLERHGFAEETFVSFTFTPILGPDGLALGNYHSVRESTRTIIAERRMSLLLRLGQLTAAAQRMKDYWHHVLLALETNEKDVPYAILYSIRGTGDTDTSSMSSDRSSSNRSCSFEGSIGVPVGHACAPLLLDLDQSTEGFAPHFRRSMKEKSPLLVETEHFDFTKLLASMSTTPPKPRGFGDVTKHAVICPLRPTNEENIVGFLVLGVNPRRPYDTDYQIFTELLARQLETSLGSTTLYEEETRRGRSAAAQAELEQAQLSEELQLRTEEIKATEQRFTKLTQLAPVGIFIRDASGNVVYCNDKWYEITGAPKCADGRMSWKTTLEEANAHVRSKEWDRLLTEKTLVTYETKLKIPWKPPIQLDDGVVLDHTWILTSAYPELDANGRVKNIVGFITDISQQKWAENVQERKVNSVLEAKRQQENFIDMTSHEIRNPLSAIMQCADGIISWLDEIKSKNHASLEELLESSVDAAQTILYCAQHQKNIVDDILTLSKLDANLLMITPVQSDPVEIVEHAFKMFEVQLTSNNITAKVQTDISVIELGAAQVELDPSRLMQVLVNLITNAIKFTKSQPRREINITIAASLERPLTAMHDIQYFPRKTNKSRSISISDNPSNSDSNPDTFFLHFAVTDTGCGLSTEEKKMLFMRFSQASPRTHVQYGGSGLGLFICRELINLQDGQIGVESTPNVGSTFAFYIQVHRAKGKSDLEAIDLNSMKLQEATHAHTPVDIPLVSTPPPLQTPPWMQAKMKDRMKSLAAPPVLSMNQLNILVVEDNLVNQRVLAKQLRNQSCSVEVANHGQEALTFIRTTRFWRAFEDGGKQLDLILMDVEMPVMDGLTCTGEIRRLQRANEIIKHIPIIAVTANARKEQIEQAVRAGIDRVISKPFRIKELMVLMEKTIQEMREKHG